MFEGQIYWEMRNTRVCVYELWLVLLYISQNRSQGISTAVVLQQSWGRKPTQGHAIRPG